MKRVKGLLWFATMIQRQNWRNSFQKPSSMDNSHDADAMVSKEAFSLLSTSTIAAVGMDIRVYRHSQAQSGGFLQVK